MLMSLYQIFIFPLGHLHFFLHFFFMFMENLFKKHPIYVIRQFGRFCSKCTVLIGHGQDMTRQDRAGQSD